MVLLQSPDRACNLLLLPLAPPPPPAAAAAATFFTAPLLPAACPQLAGLALTLSPEPCHPLFGTSASTMKRCAAAQQASWQRSRAPGTDADARLCRCARTAPPCSLCCTTDTSDSLHWMPKSRGAPSCISTPPL